ncbi:acyl carrier protein [Nocardia sp. NPDC004722]
MKLVAGGAPVTAVLSSYGADSFVDDLDIDSLSMVEIAVQTVVKYGVKIPDEDLASLKTVGDAVAYIQKLEAENADAAAELKSKFGAEGE